MKNKSGFFNQFWSFASIFLTNFSTSWSQIIPRNSVDYYYYRAAQNYGHKSTYDSRFPNIFLRGTFKTDKRKLIKSLAQTEKSRKMSFKVCTKKGLESYQLIESDFLSKYGTLFTGLHPVA